MDNNEIRNIDGNDTENTVPNVSPMPSEAENRKNEAVEAEHVISYRPEDAQTTQERHSTESSVRPGMLHNGEARGSYTSVYRTAAGDITYTSAETPKKAKAKKHSKAGLVAALVVACMFLSIGFGMFGAYITNEYLINENGDDLAFATDDISGDGKKPADGTSNGREDPADTSAGGQVVIYRDPSVSTSAEGSDFSYSDVEAVTGDSVVAISTEFMVQGLWGYVNQGAGSGVVMSADGYIITNNHVVASNGSTSQYADTITVRMKNGDEYDATVIGGNAESDIAVIKAELPEDVSLTPAVFGDSDTLAVGEEVVAIGNPLGELSGTLTNGIISALAREVEVEGVTMNLLQTNAAINPGNSGGGLFNMDGKLVGIVNAKSSGTGIEGIGFAIPANDALETAENIIENGGNVNEPTVIVGITTYNIETVSDARKFGVNALGVYIYSVEEGYNDDVLKRKDRIIAVDGIEISSGTDVSDIVKSHRVGDVLEFTIYRDGKLKTVDVTCFSSEGSSEK